MTVSFPGVVLHEPLTTGPVRAVYRATEAGLGRAVRVVCLAQGVAPSSPLARALVREAKILASLEHPSIIPLLTFHADADIVGFVLPEAAPHHLAGLVSKRLRWEVAAAIVAEVAHALAHAHSRRVVHGRLTKDSLALRPSGQIWLEDFASATFAGEAPEPVERHRPGGLAPETTLGEPPTPLSDLFALGCLLYELISGKAPFGEPSDEDYQRRVRTYTPPRLEGEFPASLRALTERCLAKRPQARPEDAEEIADLLEQLLTESPADILSAFVKELALGGRQQPERPRRIEPKSPKLLLQIGGGVALGVLLILGGYFTARLLQPAAEPVTQHALESLADAKALRLRVLATPWAHVEIDGVLRETTPFAYPISLTPGKHLVRLLHPDAPPEERTIEGAPGQTIFLDVMMHLTRSRAVALPSALPEDSTP